MEIYVEPKKLRAVSPEFDKLSQDISDIERLFSNCIRTLDWKVKSSAAVTRNMLFISEKLNNVERLLQEHSNYLINSAERYERTDGDKASESSNLEYEFNDNRSSTGNTALENYIKENLPWLYDWWHEIRKYIDISNITGDWAEGGFDLISLVPGLDFSGSFSNIFFYGKNDRFFEWDKKNLGYNAKISAEGSILRDELKFRFSDLYEADIYSSLINGHASASSSAGLFKDGMINPFFNAKAEAGVSAADVGFNSKFGDGGWATLYGSGSLSVLTGAASAEAKCSIFNNKGEFDPSLNVGASAKAAVAEGNVKVKGGDSTFGADVGGKGTVLGAEASASAGLGKIKDKDGNESYGAKAEAKAMAYGAKGEVEGGVTFMGIRIGGKVSGYAGAAGAKVGGSVSTDGVTIGGAAALLLGAGGEVSIDWSGFDDWVDEKGADFAEWAENSAENFNDFIDSAGDTLDDIGDAVGDFLSDWW